MVKRLLMVFAGLFLCLGMALAQSQVSGTVVDEQGEPVVGASIRVSGTNTGTITDVDGNFSISAPLNSRLEISYIGMQTKTVKAAGKMNVTLLADNNALDEVVVVAYGTEKRSSFTGSASVVGSETIGKVQVTSPVEALKGRVAGVQMTQTSGRPGSKSTIRVRGISSINAGNDPLVVLDGSPMPSDFDLNTVNPADIENMTVLKDAASTALYGARGANGVVIITTKTAKAGKGTITVDAKWGSMSRQVPDYDRITSPAGYYEIWYQSLNNYAMQNQGMSASEAHAWANAHVAAADSYGLGYQVYNVPAGQDFIGTNGKVNPNATLGNIVTYKGNQYLLTPDDWVDETFHNALRQEYNITASAANDRGSFYASTNYLKINGQTVGSGYERYVGRLKADYKLKDWLKFTAGGSFTHYQSKGTGDEGLGTSSGNIFATTSMGAIYPVYVRDANGNIIFDPESGINTYDYGDGKVNGQVRPYLAQSNPISAGMLDKNSTEGNTATGLGNVDITLPYGFKVSLNNSVYLDEFRGTSLTNAFYGQYVSSNGIIGKSHGRVFSYDLQQLLNWAHQYGKHSISAMVGHDYTDNQVTDLSASKSNMFSPNNLELDGAVVDGSPSSNLSKYNTEEYLFRTHYNWNDRYYGQFSYVRQASSRFAKDSRWGNFWSLGGAWQISNEEWFKAAWVDDLKLKVSYGQNGNDNISNWLYTDRYTITPSNGQVSLVPSSVQKTEDITWEKVGEFNAGVDFSFFKSRLSGTVEYFWRKTTDMLFSFNMPISNGYSSYWDNIGDMVNEGVEFTLNGDIIRGKDLTWSANLNFSYDHNWISKLADGVKNTHLDGYAGYVGGSGFIGEKLSVYTLRQKLYAGVDPATGEALYWKDTYKTETVTNADGTTSTKNVLDENGDPVINGRETTTNWSEASYHITKNARPEVFGGFGTSLAWKGFDLSCQFSYQLGGTVVDSNYQSLMDASVGAAFSADLLNAWSPTNTTSNIPRINYNDTYDSASSDRWNTSASYLALDNIQLGYTFRKDWIRGLGLSNLRLYVTADNVYLWSHRKGLDPRLSISGSTSTAYHPLTRTISGGITVSF